MLSLLSVTSAGCAPTVVSECAWARPILPSPRDVLTRGTVEAVVAHNELWEKYCAP